MKHFALCLMAGLMATSLARAAENELSDPEKKDGWILLFDGKSLDGWLTSAGKPVSNEKIQEGAFNPFKVGGVPYYSRQKFGDFVLALDFKVSPKCNSGVFVRMADPKNPVFTGFEIQVLDSFGKAKVDKHDCGALYDALEPSKNACKAPGEWQHMEVTAQANRISVVLNGEKVVEADLDKWIEVGKNPDGTKNKYKTPYKDMAREGFVGLQDHGHDVWYKNIKVKVLGK